MNLGDIQRQSDRIKHQEQTLKLILPRGQTAELHNQPHDAQGPEKPHKHELREK